MHNEKSTNHPHATAKETLIIAVAKTVKKLNEEAKKKNLLIKTASGYTEEVNEIQGCIIIHGGIEPHKFVIIIIDNDEIEVNTFEQVLEDGLSLEAFLELEGIPYMTPHIPEYENSPSLLWKITEVLTLDATNICPDITVKKIVDFLQEPVPQELVEVEKQEELEKK